MSIVDKIIDISLAIVSVCAAIFAIFAICTLLAVIFTGVVL